MISLIVDMALAVVIMAIVLGVLFVKWIVSMITDRLDPKWPVTKAYRKYKWRVDRKYGSDSAESFDVFMAYVHSETKEDFLERVSKY